MDSEQEGARDVAHRHCGRGAGRDRSAGSALPPAVLTGQVPVSGNEAEALLEAVADAMIEEEQ